MTLRSDVFFIDYPDRRRFPQTEPTRPLLDKLDPEWWRSASKKVSGYLDLARVQVIRQVGKSPPIRYFPLTVVSVGRYYNSLENS